MLDVPTPPPLAKPPVLVHYTLENPWAVFALLLLAAAVVFSVMRSRDRTRRGAAWAGALAAAAVALAVAAHFVTTAREAIAARTRELVRCVAEADITALDSVLDEPSTLYYFQAPDGLGRAGIIAAVSASFAKGGPYRVADWQVEAVQTRATGPTTGQAQVKVFVRPDQWNMPHHSWWRIDFVKGADGAWRASAIVPVEVQGVDNPRGR